MNTTPSPAIEAVELPEPHVLNGHYRDHTDKVDGYSESQVLALLAAKQEEVDKMREAATKAADVFAGTPWRNWKIDKAVKELRAALSPTQGVNQ